MAGNRDHQSFDEALKNEMRFSTSVGEQHSGVNLNTGPVPGSNPKLLSIGVGDSALEREWSEIFTNAFGEMLGALIIGILGFFAASSSGGNLFVVSIVFGFAFTVACVVLKRVSLCHFNPMVTLASVFLDSRTGAVEALIVILAQCLGFVVAAAICMGMFTNGSAHDWATVVVDPYNSGNYNAIEALLAGIVGSAIWITMVIELTMDKDYEMEMAKNSAYVQNALILGLAFAAFELAMIPIAGGSFNLARGIAANLVMWRWNPIVANSYWSIPLGDFLGGLVAIVVSFALYIFSTKYVSRRRSGYQSVQDFPKGA